MKQISIAILDNDAVRAEAIRETLADENYSAKIYTTEIQALKAIIEEKYDVIFLSADFSPDIKDLVARIRNYDHKVSIVCILSGADVEAQVMASEVGIRHFMETPVVSTKYILDKMETVEAEIMEEDQKDSFFLSMLTDLKKLPNLDKQVKRKINVAHKMFLSSEEESGKIKGSLSDVPYFDVVRLVSGAHKEGALEFVNNEERAVFVIKNRAVVSAFVTPGVRGLKAFLRVAGWENGHFTFKDKINVSYSIEHDIAFTDIPKLCSIARRTYEWFLRMRNNVPPRNLGVKISSDLLNKKQDLTSVEFDVLTTVVEKNNVMDILNYNSNTDVDILDALIGLRRKGVIEVLNQ